MTSEELADAVEDAIRRTRGRVLGVGLEQYDEGDIQRFEWMELDELLDWTLEEVDDLVVYGVMLGIRLRRLQKAIQEGPR